MEHYSNNNNNNSYAIPIIRPSPTTSPTLTSLSNSDSAIITTIATKTTSASSQFSAKALTAPIFVPNAGGNSFTLDPLARTDVATTRGTVYGMGVEAQEFIPRQSTTPALSEDAHFYSPEFEPNSMLSDSTARQGGSSDYYLSSTSIPNNVHESDQGRINQHSRVSEAPADMGDYDYNGQSSSRTDQYFDTGTAQFTRQPLQHHLYHPSPSSTLPSQSFFIPSSLHIALTDKSEAINATAINDMHLPEDVAGYTDLILLEKNRLQNGKHETISWNGYRSWVYKAWKSDGKVYALRRIEGFRLQHEAAITVIEKWTRIRHPGLVAVREAFTTRAFGDYSIIFVYDYHPCSETLYDSHLSPLSILPPNPWGTISNVHNPHPVNSHSQYRGGGGGIRNALPVPNHAGGLAERLMWSYIVQLGSAIKTVHNAGLAVKNLEVNRIIVTGINRVRIGGCGVLDVINWDSAGLVTHQQEDLLSFGKLIIALACGSTSSVHNLPKSVDQIARLYSSDLKNVVLYLLSKPGPRKTIEEVLAIMGGRVLDELNASFGAEDILENALMSELENGRLVRLLAKFGFINERPEFDHDPKWAETGDRYIIKLFRDYVFHQVDENGRPNTDLSHVLTCLNKLDAGVDEKIMLISRDEQSCLIVSYREVQKCINAAFGDLAR